MKRLRGFWGGLSRRERIAAVVVLVLLAVGSLAETEDVAAFIRSVEAWLGGAL